MIISNTHSYVHRYYQIIILNKYVELLLLDLVIITIII